MLLSSSLLGFDVTTFGIPLPVALALVALLGYIVGRWQKKKRGNDDLQSRREIKRAQVIARDLETIARDVRKNVARHHAAVEKFKNRLSHLGDTPDEAAWRELCQEVEDILGPTMQLATNMATAYDEIRRQSNQLMTFTALRTDPLTGVSNRRAMDETLNSWVAMKDRYELGFSIAIFDIDHFKQVNDAYGHLAGDKLLKNVARLIDETARETDIVTRYGGEEFVVLMPQTDLKGAAVFADRVRRVVEQKSSVTLSGGAAAAVEGESREQLLERADSSLYDAKQRGRNRVSLHDGETVVPVESLLETQESAVPDADEPVAAEASDAAPNLAAK